MPSLITLDRLDLALGIVGALGSMVCLALAIATLRATLADLDGLQRLAGEPGLEPLEAALLVLASRSPDGELRAGAIEDGGQLILPAACGRCLQLPSEAPLRRLAESRLLFAQPLPGPTPHGPPGSPAEVRQVTLYRLTLRGWKRARGLPEAVLAGELARRAYPRTGSSANNRTSPG